jgi:hypothetical protein
LYEFNQYSPASSSSSSSSPSHPPPPPLDSLGKLPGTASGLPLFYFVLQDLFSLG